MSSHGSGPDNDKEEYQAAVEISTQGNEKHININQTTRNQRRKNKRSRERKNSKLRKNTVGHQPDEELNRQYDDEESTWGDELQLSPQWPNQNNNSTIRLVHYNANGISAGSQYIEWETMLQSAEDIQADIVCLNETKIDTRKSKVQYEVRQIAKTLDKFIHINMNSSKQPTKKKDSVFKPGGTMINVRGHWAGRIIKFRNDTSADPLGRWTVSHMKGKGNTIVSIFSVYRVCSYDQGDNTVYIQQQNDIYNQYKRIMDPRQKIIKDLQRKLLDLIAKGHKVIIAADINDDAGFEFKNHWNTMMEEIGMRNVIQGKHNKRSLPRTYDRGKRCLDLLAVSNNIQDKEIVRCGILPFYSLGASDHRALYIDIATESLFEDETPDPTNHTFRRFTTKNTYKCNKYIEALTNLFKEAQIFKKIKEVKSEIEQFIENLEKEGRHIGTETDGQLLDKQALEAKLQKLDTKRYQLMIAAERNCGIAPMKGMFWYSKELKQAAKKLSDAKKKVKWMYKNEIEKDIIIVAKEERNKALKELRQAQKESRRYRDEMLDDLAEKKSKPWNMAKEKAAKVLKEAEKMSQCFKKINVTIKETNHGGIRSLLIPTDKNKNKKVDADSDDTNGNWEEIRNTDEIYTLLLEQNATMLCKSNQGITATGPLAEDIGINQVHEPFIDKILRGEINATQYAKHYTNFSEEAKTMIINMQKHPQSNTMQWKFGSEEYRQLFNKTREDTSCGPSGLHMSHWKAATESDEISFVHATMTWAAFKLGITYTRWNISFHCMLQKLSKPYVHKLRIIQIFEGDMNGGFKYLFGKLLMKQLVENGTLNDHAYGSIPGRDTLEALKALQYLYENHRLLKKDMIVIFNDAAGCYDRIRPNQAEICSRRVGCPISLAKTHTRIQTEMTHHIKTASGISKGTIKSEVKPSNEEKTVERTINDEVINFSGNIGGVGQGGGASPIEWLVILLVLLNAFKAFSEGAKLIDPEGLFGGIIPMISFVDDNSITLSISNLDTIDEVFEMAGKCMLHWKRLLQTTGGDLAPHKCTVTVMRWKWGKRTGQAMLVNKNESPGTIVLKETTKGQEETVQLKRLEINEGERQLGVILPVDGSFKQEYEVRLLQSQTLGRKLYRAPLNHYESTLVYKLYYVPKISYPLSITQFSQQQCDKIQSNFYKYGLAKMGINRKTPKALIFGPMSLSGFEFHDVYCAQLHQHILKITQHMRREDNVGKGIMSNIHILSCILGSAQPLFNLSRTRYMYADGNTTVHYLWKMNKVWSLNMHYPGVQCNPRRYNNEINTIMDDAVYDAELEWDETKLRAINSCRLYHGLTYPSDMLHYNRRYINKEYLNGVKSMRTTIQKETWPEQPLPLSSQWTYWRAFIRRKYIMEGTMQFHRDVTQDVPLSKPTNSVIDELHDMYLTTETDQILEYYIQKLPNKYQKYTQYWEKDKSSLQQFKEAMLNNTLHVATDGSYTPDTLNGSGAAVMMDDHDESESIIMIGAKCAMIEGMTSLTAEQSGLIGGILLVHMLCLYSGQSPTKCVIHFWIDNAEALRRITTIETDDIRLKAFGARDYGDLKVMRDLHAALPHNVNIKYHKIKSHQDEVSTDLTFEARLNTQADAAAQFINITLYGPSINYEVTEADGLVIKNNQQIVIQDIVQFTRVQVKGDTTRDYLKRKNHWTNTVLNTIDWNGIESYLKGLPIQKRYSILQLVHNWQNTGAQKELFSHNTSTYKQMKDPKLLKLVDEQIAHDASCPFQCGMKETHMHYMECGSSRAISKRRELTKKFKKSLDSSNVHEAITSLILWGLNWTSTKGIPTCILLEGELNVVVQKAIVEQTKIGWHNVRRGFISNQWSLAQTVYNKQQKISTNSNWSKILLHQILTVSWSMWNTRNEVLHGTNSNERQEKAREKLIEQIEYTYKKAGELREYNKEEIDYVFKTSVKKRKQHGLMALETWLQLANGVLATAESRANSKLMQWLNRENTYQCNHPR